MSKLRKALEKAKANGGYEQKSFNDKLKIKDTEKSPPVDHNECRPELSIKYSSTKVKRVDDRILKKGKVISFFHDLEKVDQIKTLRTHILNKLNKIKGNSLLVTSANPYEGKTFTAINLGVSIAQEFDRTVLLVDCDLKSHSKPHKNLGVDFLGIQVDKGLTNYLLNQSNLPDLLFNPGIERLVILPAGKPIPNSAEMLGSAKMDMLVRDIKCRYPEDRIVIFDTSSLLASADPLVLTRFVDGILLVVEEEKTTTNDIKKAMELIKDKPVIGTVMNKARSLVH
jgi:capsular exopolysaccharide synthesis family protein